MVRSRYWDGRTRRVVSRKLDGVLVLEVLECGHRYAVFTGEQKRKLPPPKRELWRVCGECP